MSHYAGDEIRVFEKYGNALLNVINAGKTHFTMSIDAPWGAGKTTFINMWAEHLRSQDGIKVVILNAFEHDMEEDPFNPIACELIALVEKQINKENITKRAANTTKHMCLNFGKNLIELSTLGLIKPENIDQANEMMEQLRFHSINQEIKSYQEKKKDVGEFKKAVADALAGENHRVVFIIDELDRCVPRMAVRIIERVSHFFDINGLFFVFAINSEELCSSIQGLYGASYNARTYLNKFIHHHTKLPGHDGNYMAYSSYLKKRMELTDYLGGSDKCERLCDLMLLYFKCTMRDIEQIATVLLLLDSQWTGSSDVLLSLYLAITKVKDPIELNNEGSLLKAFMGWGGQHAFSYDHDSMKYTWNTIKCSVVNGY